MRHTDLAPIQNAVLFLTWTRPEELSRLRGRFLSPEEQALLSEHEQFAPLSQHQRVKVEVVHSALEEFLFQWERLRSSSEARMERARLWKVLGSLVGILGSGVTFGLLSSQVDSNAAKVSAVVALLGGLASLAVDYLHADILDRKGAVPKAYADLRAGVGQAAGLLRELRPYLTSGDDGGYRDELEKLIAGANKLIGQMHEQLEILRGAAQ